MKRSIRRLLRGTAWYAKAAYVYHSFKNLTMRFRFFFKEAKYLHPIKLSGNYKSQYGQDYYLEKYKLINKEGFFVEVGCNHPVHNSNSYYLEKCMGWRGVSIDGIDYSELYLEQRKNTIFIHALIDKSAGESIFYQVKDEDGWENQVSSIHKATLSMGKGFVADIKKVRTIPLSEIEEIATEIDLMLIDVEGHEFSVLDSLNWETQSPKVIVIENNGEFYQRKKLEDFMKMKNYKLFARIGTADDIYVSNR